MHAKKFPCGLSLDVALRVSGGSIERVTLTPGKSGILLCHVDTGSPLATRIFAWFDAYSRRIDPKFSLPLKLPTLAPFSKKVVGELRKIPLGSTCSYEELARLAESPSAARAVGSVCHQNPLPLLIPCHRVVRKDGTLGGFAYGLRMKEELLRFERN